MGAYLRNIVLAKHVHAVALSVARYFPALLPYHAWFMWTFREQPGPVRWRDFLAGIWARLSGRSTGGPWPRIGDVTDADSTGTPVLKAAVGAFPTADKQDAAPEDSPPFHPVDPSTLTTVMPRVEESDLASEEAAKEGAAPIDVLTPPYTPATQSPVGMSPSPRSASPTSELELPTAVTGDVASTSGKSTRAKVPWPILEDEPIYRVDLGVNIFNYDCGLCVGYSSCCMRKVRENELD